MAQDEEELVFIAQVKSDYVFTQRQRSRRKRSPQHVIDDELLLQNNDYPSGHSIRGRNNDRLIRSTNSMLGYRSQSPKLINIQIDSNLEGQTIEGSMRID